MAELLHDTAYAKINLALHVRHRRADGYHALETLFVFAEDGDELTATPSDAFNLTISGPFGQGLSAEPDNLVLKAVMALAKANGIKSGLALTLDKQLPIAAGIGGGSADAAAALRLAAKIWQLGPDTIGPEVIAPAIGADVPACLHAQSCYGSGVGDALTDAPDLGLKGQPILLVNPNVACPTGPVFAAWDGVDRGPLSLKDWQLGRNDLEQPAIGLVPVITDVLDLLAGQPGVDLARMSGSGATCFALFSDAQKRDAAVTAIAAARPSWWTLATRLR
ncbi:MAG: 4-(cytidine 5'-diphospho)-2-C-methyl-D-erythritol kinase [Chakrabartia sp.]